MRTSCISSPRTAPGDDRLHRLVNRAPPRSGTAGRLARWSKIERGVSSSLIDVECLRTIDRFRLEQGLTDKDHARRRAAIYAVIDELDIVEITRPVLSRASQPMPTVVGTLDATHLATALLWREQSTSDLTHDDVLGRAGESFGFEVIGT